MQPEENQNFVRLVQNEFNKSCKCNTPGYKYDPYFNTCFDIDECEIDNNLCSDPNSVCVNNVGRFSCPCRSGRGYIFFLMLFCYKTFSSLTFELSV